MKTVRVCYQKIGNMGDLLNELIVEKVLGYRIELSDRWKCRTTGIGSHLILFFTPESKRPGLPKRIAQKVYGALQPPVQIWSTGFLDYSDETHHAIRREVNVSAVRGELSRRRLETILGRELDVPLGDGGLLASRLFEKPIPKKYAIGVIPHFREAHEPRFRELQESYPNSVLVDLAAEPMSVIRTIAECETIVSSALHGLIVADSFGIPNKRLVYSKQMLGDGFKYDDYYSAFDLRVKPFDLNEGGAPPIESVVEDYGIRPAAVKEKQDRLIEAFSRYV